MKQITSGGAIFKENVSDYLTTFLWSKKLRLTFSDLKKKKFMIKHFREKKFRIIVPYNNWPNVGHSQDRNIDHLWSLP